MLICLALLIPFKVNGQQTANSFQYPLSSYQVGCNDFWGTCVKAWHLGEDVSALAGTPVYAPADGTVKHVNVRAQYGNVIVIEHKIPNDFVCTVMGHLRPDVKVSVGQYVTKGQLLGYLGTRLQNGGWDEHIHFGINKGSYAGDYATTCGSDWVYGGYTSCESVKNDWHDPSDFINNYQTRFVGLFSDGHVDQRFVDFYNSCGGASTFGSVFSNPTPYVHLWGDLYVQDFKKGDVWSQLVLNSTVSKAYAVFNKILYFWNSNWGYRDYGPPFTNEFAISYVGNQAGVFGEQDILSPR